MFSMGESKAQTAEDVLDNSSKTMSIKERYLNFFLFLMNPINSYYIDDDIKRSFKTVSKKAK